MKKLLFISTLLFFSLLQVSCNSDAISNTDAATNPVDVYIAGSKDGKACYWKNGQIVILNSVTFTGTSAKKIIVSNGNIFVLGEGFSNLASNQLTSLYWKNGVLTNLNTSLGVPSFSNTLGITDMDVVGSDVYFVGYVPSLVTIPNPPISLVCWKNNIATTVKNYNTSFYNTVSRIKVLNNVVYVTGPGTTNNPNFFINGYYANNVFNEIPNATINGFAINSNQMYVFGRFIAVFLPVPAINGFYTNIQTNVQSTTTIGIDRLSFDNNNVFYSDLQQIFKNGNSFFSTMNTQSYIVDFKVINNNFYKIATSGGVAPGHFLEINDVTTSITALGESYASLFIVQN